jgi:hypothetical protein
MPPIERIIEGYRGAVRVDEARRERYRPLTEGIKDPARVLALEYMFDKMLETKFGDRYNAEARTLVKDIAAGRVTEQSLRRREETTTADIATYVRAIFPVITRTYWQLMLMNLISTQPMSGPTARIFFKDILYSSTGGLYNPSLYAGGARTDLYIDPYYADSVEAPGDTVRYLDLSITSRDLAAKTKRLNAKWTDELEQDLRAAFGMDMDGMMVGELGDEIAREIDQEGLDILLAGATAGNVNWSETPPSGAYSSLDPKVWGSTMWDALIDADQLIYDGTGRNSTWLVMGSTEVNRLRKLRPMALQGGPGPANLSARNALEFQGVLGERWEIFQARHWPAGKILMGFRGQDFTEAPAVHAPYIPLQIKEAVKDLTGDDAYKTIRGAQWRGNTQVVMGEGLATVTVTG